MVTELDGHAGFQADEQRLGDRVEQRIAFTADRPGVECAVASGYPREGDQLLGARVRAGLQINPEDSANTPPSQARATWSCIASSSAGVGARSSKPMTAMRTAP